VDPIPRVVGLAAVASAVAASAVTSAVAMRLATALQAATETDALLAGGTPQSRCAAPHLAVTVSWQRVSSR